MKSLRQRPVWGLQQARVNLRSRRIEKFLDPGPSRQSNQFFDRNLSRFYGFWEEYEARRERQDRYVFYTVRDRDDTILERIQLCNPQVGAVLKIPNSIDGELNSWVIDEIQWAWDNIFVRAL